MIIQTTERSNDATHAAWFPFVKEAAKKVWERFHCDQKTILTESDLKCWLFYELVYPQEDKNVPKDKKPDYAVHTEVTHRYEAERMNRKTKKNEVKDVNKFRDLSLLQPDMILTYRQAIDEGRRVLSKSFSHIGTALHFELKFVRENYNLTITEDDIAKLNDYANEDVDPKRRFVLLWGCYKEGESAQRMFQKFSTPGFHIKSRTLKNNLKIFLFDHTELLICQFDNRGDLTIIP